MLNGGQHRFRDVIASTIGWWAEAGLDTLADEQPRDWLEPPAKAPKVTEAPAAAPSPSLPEGIEALHALLATGDYAPQSAPPGRRIAPSGAPGAALMIIADMPDADDAGHLFAGETAKLFDAMLAAMGVDRGGIYLAPFSPARAAGRIAPEQGEALTILMRRHIALATPKTLMIFGDEPARWLIGPETLQIRGGLRHVNHDGGTVPAIATFHPRHLRRMPALKASAWADMRLLLGVLGQ
ncbi:uracil-DNA glycosylase [Sphingomonas sp. CGMCC 1.13654]|uniref:Uracil-DNA glycosylase n=1 Tax=Sphingomonas chungangi TaxID=2683589 RepID=A0A838LCA3_9SPHN|nr:uracil-DNA glycosylase family protein [Sphingomonas chungangi]MBA2936355.1 uracil-DNA glycosylase [Sphingomonas chungangi]MVW55740.1 uracil-DNA glycosylase [Sphingomonas chungangi]